MQPFLVTYKLLFNYFTNLYCMKHICLEHAACNCCKCKLKQSPDSKAGVANMLGPLIWFWTAGLLLGGIWMQCWPQGEQHQ